MKAKEMMYSGRNVTGIEASVMGLVNKCVPDEALMDVAVKMARGFLKNSWFTLRADKWLVNQGQNHTLEEGLRFEREKSPGRGPDQEERMKNFGST